MCTVDCVPSVDKSEGKVQGVVPILAAASLYYTTGTVGLCLAVQVKAQYKFFVYYDLNEIRQQNFGVQCPQRSFLCLIRQSRT
jgi:hypothetical protein